MTHFLSFLIISFIATSDQFTKYIICSLQDSLPLKVTSFLNLVFTQNRGMSFGILNHKSSIVFYTVTGIVIGLCIYLGYWLLNETNKKLMWGLSFILGGAIGNTIDRIFRQGVVDFLDFHFYSYHWPAFNLADSFIFLGVALLLCSNIKNKEQRTS